MKDIQVFTPKYALELIERELQKRATTYPKIIARKKKAAIKGLIAMGVEPEHAKFFAEGETNLETEIQRLQVEALEIARSMIGGNWGNTAPFDQWPGAALTELRRELKMRKSLYPRFIYLKRITPEVAERELADWETLVEYFIETFIAKS